MTDYHQNLMPHTAIEPKLERGNRALLVAAVLLTVGVLLTVWFANRNHTALAQAAQRQFTQQVDALGATTQARLEAPAAVLLGLRSLFAAHGKPTAKSLQAWVQAQDLSHTAPGVRGVGWLERVPRVSLPQFLAAARAEQGMDFQIALQGNADPLFILKAIEPRVSNGALWAQDASGQTVLMEALNRAVTQGEAVMARSSAPAGSPWGSDFYYFKPEYRTNVSARTPSEREAALAGIWVVRLDMATLLSSALAPAEEFLDFALLDAQAGSASAPVFSSANTTGSSRWQPRDFSKRELHAHRTLLVAGRRFSLQAGSNAAFEAARDRSSTTLIGAAGLGLSVLLALTAWLMLTRKSAYGEAHTMVRDLARLTRIIKGTSHVVFVGDAQRDIVWVNEAFTRLTGLDAQQAMGRRFDRLVDLEGADDTVVAQLRQALDQRESLRTQLRLRTRDGELHWFDLDLQAEHDAHGAYAGYIVIAADITAQRQANEQAAAALRENEALMAVIDQHSLVSITDYRGNITYANDMFCQISGYSREELLGSNHRIVKSDQQDGTFWEAMWKTISSGYTWRATVCNRARDGSLYWVDSVVSPFFDEAGNIEKYVSIRSNVTSARQAQEELANEREHLNAILVGTDAGTWEWDVPGGQFVINSRWAEIVGYTLADLGSVSVDTWSELCHPDDLLLAKELLHQHFSGTLKSYSCEIRMRHRDGHWVWVLSSGKVSAWVAPGQPRWVSGIQLDITVQKSLQFELHQNNQVMQSILANIPVALSVFDSHLQLIARNDKFIELLEFPSWLFEGPITTFESLIRYNASRGEYGAGDVEHAVEYIIERARNTTPHQFERVRPNGQALEVRGAPMPGGGFITTYADISERKKAEAEIQRSTGLLQSVLDSASEVSVISIDMGAVVTLFNKGAERMFGYAAADVVGQQTLLYFFGQTELKARSAAMSAQLGYAVSGLDVLIHASVLGRRTEWNYVHKDGHQFSAALVVTAMTDSGGKRIGYLAVSHDITQEKDNEQALLMAVELAEQAALSKGQFLANMSHEIRTPMNAVLGMLKLLQNTTLDARQLDYITKTESAARSLLGLLNDILDYSKTEAGKMQLDPHPFAVDALLRDLSVILSANIEAYDIQLLFDVDKRLPPVLVGDALRLQQILINLGGNAIKFTERGEVVVSMQQLARTPQGVHLRILVKDSGIGIDPANQQHIFSGFSQAEASTTRRFGGSGLGLSICRRLVELMGGELKLESALGQGSRFYFDITLPIASDVEVAGMVPSPMAPAASETAGKRRIKRKTTEPRPAGAQRLAGMRLLVVEDNLINQQVAKELLSAEGALITLAGNGQLGVDAVATTVPPFDAVLMDIQMPVMDGYTATRTIRSELGLVDLPIIAITANAMASDREACIAAGMDDHIGKPFDLPKLVGMLQRYAGHKGASAMAAAAPESTRPETGVHDVEGALARLGGNMALYRQILQTFLVEIAAVPAQLYALIKSEDYDGARRLVHTIKGLSLTVGAQHLSQICKDAQQALRTAPADPSWLPRVAQAVESTVVELQVVQSSLAAPPQADAQPLAVTLEPSALREGLLALQPLLRDSDLQALEVFARLQHQPSPADAATWAALQSAMMALDFALAHTLCDTLIHQTAK
ncbi:MAG: PAS domain S-box protein [Rhodoferax sp.]|nr:PAS domain S-box protein [Rhodoferax sp.]